MKKRIKKELWMRSFIRKGYPRAVASRWYYRVRKDNRLWKDIYSKETLDSIHNKGFLAKNIERLGLLDEEGCDRISDLDYLRLHPINNAFSKWIEDINTMNRVFYQFRDYLPNVYFTIFRRSGLRIAKFPFAKEKADIEDILLFLKDNKDREYQLRPAFWKSNGKRHVIKYHNDNSVIVDETIYSKSNLKELLANNNANYVLCDKIYNNYCFDEGWKKSSFVKLYITNDYEGNEKILCAVIEEVFGERQILIDKATGKFTAEETEITIPNWEQITGTLVEMAEKMRQIAFFSVSISIQKEGFKIINCSYNPFLPKTKCTKELNDYLLGLLTEKNKKKITFGDKFRAIKDSLFKKFVNKYCRKGIRPYMQKLWFEAVKSDLKDKGTSLRQKIWAWKRGFLSFRIQQYGLTEDNYKNFLSDYDYHWLNRINGVFQGWINDKTTFRFIMEPVKEYVPEYYFSIFKRNNKVIIGKMPDCPEELNCDFQSVVKLLKERRKLVFKPSAGTHGDGFYCIEFDGENFLVNSELKREEELVEILSTQKSFYIVTDYIKMHPTLKTIYPNSVDSIRVMVINRQGHNPQIHQAYLRIGSSKTGFTDNVGYGGICAMVDLKTGELYDPETLTNHVYSPCEFHPDTGTKISGIVIPNWDMICEKVKEVAQLMPELEYLGFDVAATEDGLNIMEINIHQDLHKVALHPEAVRKFFADKIAQKKWLMNNSK